MNYISIDPSDHSVELFDVKSFDAALTVVGLELGRVDHGLVRIDGRKYGLVSDEFSWFEKTHFFGIPIPEIGPQLFAGPCLVYGLDGGGNTRSIDPDELPFPIIWYDTPADLEAALQRGEAGRPSIVISGAKVWAWPEPKPDFLKGKSNASSL